MPYLCQNERETAVTSGHPRAPRTASDLDKRRLTRCVKRPSKQRVAAELVRQSGTDVNIGLTVFFLVRVISYSSGVQQPTFARASWTSVRTHTELHRLIASSVVPTVRDEEVDVGRVNVACGSRRESGRGRTAELSPRSEGCVSLKSVNLSLCLDESR